MKRFLQFGEVLFKNASSTFLIAQMADRSESGSLEIEQFVHFYKILTQRDEVWQVFQDYSGDGETLTLEELENFLTVEQQEGEQSSRHAQELIQQYEPSETGDLFLNNHRPAFVGLTTLRTVHNFNHH